MTDKTAFLKVKQEIDTIVAKVDKLIEPTVKQQKYPNLYVYGETHYLNIADILNEKDRKVYMRLHNKRMRILNSYYESLIAKDKV